MEINPNALNVLYLVSGIIVGFLAHETWNDITFWWKERQVRKQNKKEDNDG